MATPQAAICAENEDFGIFLTLTLADGEAAAGRLREVAAGLAALTASFAASRDTPSLASAIGFGAAIWPRLYGPRPPRGLAPFQPLANGHRVAPATPGDVFVHVFSARHDTNFALVRALAGQLGASVATVEEIHGFRNFQNRDLTGFVDGTENPKGVARAEVALIGDEEPDFTGGSYVHVQRYVHALSRWEALAVGEQEAAIGRSKAGSIEMADGVKPPSAHISRVVIEEDGAELEIVRRGLPYGTAEACGVCFIAYARDATRFPRMLRRMVTGGEDGVPDRLLDFTTAVTGGAFFAPSVEFLAAKG